MADIEDVLDAAQRHGEASEPDMEVGDLQVVLRHAWTLLSEEQQRSLLAWCRTHRYLED